MMQSTNDDDVKTYLDVEDGENAKGNMRRIVGHSAVGAAWMCQAHQHRYFSHESMSDLKEFVHNHGGLVEPHHGVLTVVLNSMAEADRFHSLVARTRLRFNISIRIGWKITLAHLKDLCRGVQNVYTLALEIDGSMLDTVTRDHVKYK